MQLIEALNWRYATKKFDPTKKVSHEDLEKIKEAMRLSASSYGLQPYKIFLVENQDVKEQLKPASWGQSQLTDASHAVIFAVEKKVTPELIDRFVALKSETQNIPSENLKGYGDFMKSKLVDLPEDKATGWTARQSYVALGNLLAACGELHIDACPMEGFEADKIDAILGLEARGLTTAVIATIGYRSEEDATANAPKVRYAKEDLFETV
ncbi:MAG: NAD(P)H-dependent oxidoreductase [Salibacteraceae bacterium]